MESNTAIVNAEPKAAPLQLPEETASLIKASIAENTQKSYQRALHGLETWLSDRMLSDVLLANYITALHEAGKSPATIGQAVAAVKWQLKHQSQETFNFPITQATLAGIRREGRDRGRGQVDGLIWQRCGKGLCVCGNGRHNRRLTRCRDDTTHERLSIADLVKLSPSMSATSKASTLTLRSSKTDQEGTGEALYVCENTRQILKQYTRTSRHHTRRSLPTHPPRRPHPVASPHTPLRTPYHSETRTSRRCRRLHLRSFPPRRLSRLPRPSRRNRRRYASRRTLEILTNAGTLCESRVSRARRNRTIQRR